MNDASKISSDFRVGILTFTALCFLVLAILFAGGDKGLFFQKTASLEAWLLDIGGLKKGAAVTMGGMVIGKVTSMEFIRAEDRAFIKVMMKIRNDMRDQIKKDSVPSIKTQGMLGDRYIEISMAGPESPTLPENARLIGGAATDFDDALKEAKSTLSETTKLLTAINSKEGTIGKLFYDEAFHSQLSEITEEVSELVKDFKRDPRKYVKLSIF